MCQQKRSVMVDLEGGIKSVFAYNFLTNRHSGIIDKYI